MDDKTFLAAYVAKEAERINGRLKAMLTNGEQPSEAERDDVVQDIETTLARLQSALSQIQLAVDAEDADEEWEIGKEPL